MIQIKILKKNPDNKFDSNQIPKKESRQQYLIQIKFLKKNPDNNFDLIQIKFLKKNPDNNFDLNQNCLCTMSNHIERWCTPWVEEVIVAAENALASQTQPTATEQLIVNTIYKTIGKVRRIENDLVHVLIRTEVGGVGIWAQEIWNIGNVRVLV